LRRQFDEPLLLGLVLLLRQRIHAAEGLAPALEPLDLRAHLFAIIAFGRLGPAFLEATPRLVRLGAEARELDVDLSRSPAGVGLGAPELRLVSTETPQLCRELARLRPSDVGTRAQRRLEASRVDVERRYESRRQLREPLDRRIRRGGVRRCGDGRLRPRAQLLDLRLE